MPMMDSINPGELAYGYEQENFFLSWTAVGADIGSYLYAGRVKKRAMGSVIDAIGRTNSSRMKDRAFRAAGGWTADGPTRREMMRDFRVGRLKRMTVTSRANWKRGASIARLSKMFSFAGVAAIGFELGQGVFNAAVSYKREARAEGASRYDQIYTERPYADSRAAATQRQRALMVIHNSQLSTRAAFGAEADYLHS